MSSVTTRQARRPNDRFGRFGQDLMLQLRADLARLLMLPAAAVYLDEEAREPLRPGVEVWIEQLPRELPEGGLQAHPYTLHLRLWTRRPELSLLQMGAVERLVETLRRRYDCARPFQRALPTLIASQVEQEEPLRQVGNIWEGSLRLVFVEVSDD